MTWRVARSLLTLRDQINARYPSRNRASDGTIGDTSHQNRNSDHNPWYGPGIVTAMDITHDPASGVDIDRLTDELAASRDPRIKYIIANGWILDSRPGYNPWKWVRYFGPNPHSQHFHLSVMPNSTCDDTRLWNLPSLRTGGGGAAPPSAPQKIRLERYMRMSLGPGDNAAYFGDIPPGASHVCVSFPRGKARVRLIFHGDEYPDTFNFGGRDSGIRDYSSKGDFTHPNLPRLRPWRKPIPEGATGVSVYWEYHPDEKYDHAAGAISFRFRE